MYIYERLRNLFPSNTKSTSHSSVAEVPCHLCSPWDKKPPQPLAALCPYMEDDPESDCGTVSGEGASVVGDGNMHACKMSMHVKEHADLL